MNDPVQEELFAQFSTIKKVYLVKVKKLKEDN
jgi:hypothetical protein